MTGRLGIDDVRPLSGDGTHPSKAVAGEHVPVTATVARGPRRRRRHRRVARPGRRDRRRPRMARPARSPTSSAPRSSPTATGLWTFRVDAWGDPWTTMLHPIEVKLAAGQTAERARQRPRARAPGCSTRWPPARSARRTGATLDGAAAALRATELPLGSRTGPALSDEVRAIMHDFPVREVVTEGPIHKVWVDRSARCTAPGTSSSRARRAASDEEAADRSTARSRPPPGAAAGRRRHGLRRRLPAADPPHRPRSTARAPTTP